MSGKPTFIFNGASGGSRLKEKEILGDWLYLGSRERDGNLRRKQDV